MYRFHVPVIETARLILRPYATEAARAAVDWGFANIPALDEIVAFTVPANVRSQRVMERIGMTRAGHRLRPHWLAATGALAIALAGVTGCWHEPEHTETIKNVIVRGRVDRDGFDGAEVSAGGGWSGVQLEVFGHFQQISSATSPEGVTSRHGGGGIDFALRASLFGMISNDHRIDKWFDIGGFAGAGGGLFKPTSRLDSYGQVWAGAWMQLGLMPGSKYWALFLDVRRVAYKGELVEDATVFGIGLGFVQRRPGYPDIRD